MVRVWAEAEAAGAQGIDFASVPDRLAAADQVVVPSGADFDAKNRHSNERLAEERSPRAMTELVRLITDLRPGEAADWMEWPTVSRAIALISPTSSRFSLISTPEWPFREGHPGSAPTARPPTLGSISDSPSPDVRRGRASGSGTNTVDDSPEVWVHHPPHAIVLRSGPHRLAA